MHRKQTHDWGFTSVRTRIAALLLAVAAVIGAVSLGLGTANAAPVPAVAGNITMLPSMVRIYGSNNALNLAAGGSSTTTVAGQTFGGQAIPENATGVTLSVSTIGDTAQTGKGQVRVWTTGAAEPGSPVVFFDAKQGATNITFVALDSNGQINIKAIDHSTRLLVGILNYVTPLAAPAAPVVKSIAGSTKTLDVGGSIRTRATDFGSVSLAAGTYDTRVIAGWTGLNNGNKDCTTDATFLTGTLVVVKGDSIAADFSNDVTAGGVIVPESNSETLTQDPTAAINTYLTLTETTNVHVQLFAYASDSSQSCSGVLKGNVQSAQFVKVA
jgi:hypothetical protein